MKTAWLLIFASLGLMSCSKSTVVFEQQAQEVLQATKCGDVESSLWNLYHQSLDVYGDLPTHEELDQALRDLDPSWISLMHQHLDVVQKYFQSFSGPAKEELSALEIGAQLNEAQIQVQRDLEVVRQEIKRVKALSPSSNCSLKVVSRNVPGLLLGNQKAFRTSYQSCEVFQRAALNRNSPELQGISITGQHPDGVGRRRVIGDLALVQRTHPYVAGVTYAQACRKVSENPLIYDYGGKPYTENTNNSALDFFRDMGTGTKVLGIDCSGYVFSVIATGGLKIHPQRTMKANLVHGINARMYMNPEGNGLTCFRKINVGQSGTLRAGDIMAGPGHVVIIDRVGTDPLGIQSAVQRNNCSSVSSQNFDFTITQSSPSKGGVGINRYEARDYLIDSAVWRAGLEAYARQACEAILKKTDVPARATDFQVIRHLGTADCMNSLSIALVGESCVSFCP
ncbi:MAG: hypothetical protein LW875_06705 [Proteobacteria bacterium]|jgi:hypothetical protein|nr:hypothetical protein [Pseudomonadota bacterium]